MRCVSDVSESNNGVSDQVTAGVEVQIDGPIKHLEWSLVIHLKDCR